MKTTGHPGVFIVSTENMPDRIKITVTLDGLITAYLHHNGVKLREFKSVGAVTGWLKRRKCIVIETIWETSATMTR